MYRPQSNSKHYRNVLVATNILRTIVMKELDVSMKDLGTGGLPIVTVRSDGRMVFPTFRLADLTLRITLPLQLYAT